MARKRKEVSAEEAVKRFRNLKNPRTFDEALAEWNELMEPEYEANRRAEDVGPEDWAKVRSALGIRPGF